MANCCRIYTTLSKEECIKTVGNHPSVIRFGENPIVHASESYFGNVPKGCEDMTEINLMNSIKDVDNILTSNCTLPTRIVQDLDAFGYEVLFIN